MGNSQKKSKILLLLWGIAYITYCYAWTLLEGGDLF